MREIISIPKNIYLFPPIKNFPALENILSQNVTTQNNPPISLRKKKERKGGSDNHRFNSLRKNIYHPRSFYFQSRLRWFYRYTSSIQRGQWRHWPLYFLLLVAVCSPTAAKKQRKHIFYPRLLRRLLVPPSVPVVSLLRARISRTYDPRTHARECTNTSNKTVE